MAWQPDPTLSITFLFRDDDGANARHIINLPASALPVAGSFAVAYAALIDSLSTCVLWKISIALRYLNDQDPVAAAGTDINRKSVFIFGLVDGGRYAVTLPCVMGSKLLQPPDPYAYVGLNTADPAIAALVAALVTGIDGIHPCAPWDANALGDWTHGGGGGGSWGGGGNATDGGDFAWSGDDITTLLTAYWGYEIVRR